MIRFVIVNYGLPTTEDAGFHFWSGKRSAWVGYISTATRYKKRDEADRIAFGMTAKNVKNIGNIAVEPASKFEGNLNWRVMNPGDNCWDCRRKTSLRDVYTCNKTCMGYRPQRHRHATCGQCGFMAILMPLHSVLKLP